MGRYTSCKPGRRCSWGARMEEREEGVTINKSQLMKY
jgi:hypothetical protein